MLIRDARAGDLPQVGALWNAMIAGTLATFTSQPKTDADLVALLAQRPGAFLVAEVDGGVAGFITWGPFRAGSGYRHTAEHTIITARPGTGIGRALIDAATLRATDQGIHVLVAAISSANPAAVAFHSRLGFAKTGHLPQVGRKNDQWLDLILMTRALAPR